ncbi:MAG TPA: UvrD-helicase domain-containing protein [Blastocatellia bacterium]|nr:UvrD-helicase domain-containing protein [Blastocatellia bacterium]
MDILDKLNPEQREAVQTVEGPLLVLAGAGSGKTRVITYRIAYLIEQAGVRPERILAVTFTNKAAQEMKSRVESLLNNELRVSSPLISTFHSLCVRILRRNIERMEAGYTNNFTIYDQDDQIRLIRQIMKDLSIDDKVVTGRQAQSAISAAKNRSQSPESFANQAEYINDRTEMIARVYKAYEQRMKQANALDFDDLLIKAVELLRRVTEVRAYYHERFRHVMIDEFQDTNGIQYELARLIVTGSTNTERLNDERLWEERSLCVVGDESQSVYSFRGADFNIILGFQHDFAGTKVIKLEQNYRSTQNILEAANHVIENNEKRFPKNLYATEAHGIGAKIGYYQSYDGEGEAAFVSQKIQEHLRQSPDVRCAVLYRTNAQSRLFEESLRRRGIEYNLVGGYSFYERAEVKDIIAYLKLALNPHDDIALNRVINTPPRGIGKTTLDTLARKQLDYGVSLWDTISEEVKGRSLNPRAVNALESFQRMVAALGRRVTAGEPMAEIVKAATIESGYVKWLQEEKSDEAEGRLLNIEELVNAAAEAELQGETLRDFIDHAALVADADQYKADARVTLMSMHSAKGLEFPVVFIVGAEEGLFPHFRAANSEDELEEERRLCYVAITRAQKRLYITHAMRRRTFGEEMVSQPSRFLGEIPLELMEDLTPGPSWMKFAGRPDSIHNREAIAALTGEPRPATKKPSTYTGKTYNSAESVREFFKGRGAGGGWQQEDKPHRSEGGGAAAGIRAGSRVRHATYGKGVVLNVEGAGDEAKLTVSFPGYGQKKFIAKYVTLEKS